MARRWQVVSEARSENPSQVDSEWRSCRSILGNGRGAGEAGHGGGSETAGGEASPCKGSGQESDVLRSPPSDAPNQPTAGTHGHLAFDKLFPLDMLSVTPAEAWSLQRHFVR